VPNQQPHVTSVDAKRRFAYFPVAVMAFIVNEREEVLLLSHPKRSSGWEVVNGALEAGETVLQGALRETQEEVGERVRVRPLGTVHVASFHYDENVQFMLSVGYLMAYESGEIQPGDDMAGSRYKWWSSDELRADNVNVLIPPNGGWLLLRAIELYRLWKGQVRVLQPELVVPQEMRPE